MDKQAFRPEETHQLLEKLGAEIEASSEGFGWTNTFASLQREPAFDNEFHAVPACLDGDAALRPLGHDLSHGSSDRFSSCPTGRSVLPLPA